MHSAPDRLEHDVERPSESQSNRWCGSDVRSAGVGLPVPISNSRNTWRASAHTISPPIRAASASPSAVLPVAVAPTSATIVRDTCP